MPVPAARLVTPELVKVTVPLVDTVPPPDIPIPAITAILVTDPFPIPAPIAVRKLAASKGDTVLSALYRGKVIALGFVIVKRFAPKVVAPKAVLAATAVVAPVPPFAMPTIPVTFDEVPVVF